MPLLFEAARNFVRTGRGRRPAAFEKFRAENAWWLDDFVLFDALRAQRQAARAGTMAAAISPIVSPLAFEKARAELADDIQIRARCSSLSTSNGGRLRRYCSERAIRMVGDVAIFVNHDSADVWTTGTVSPERES